MTGPGNRLEHSAGKNPAITFNYYEILLTTIIVFGGSFGFKQRRYKVKKKKDRLANFLLIPLWAYIRDLDYCPKQPYWKRLYYEYKDWIGIDIACPFCKDDKKDCGCEC